MNTQSDQSEIKIDESAQVKKEYQTPTINEFGSLVDLTAGPRSGDQDGLFTGTNPV